jgi:hypothetical protein
VLGFVVQKNQMAEGEQTIRTNEAAIKRCERGLADDGSDALWVMQPNLVRLARFDDLCRARLSDCFTDC